MFEIYIKNYMNGSSMVTTETLMLSIPVTDMSKHYINKPIVKQDWSAIGSFDFEIEPKSQFYNSFLHMRTILRVVYDGDTIFRGRVLAISNTMWGTRQIKCEDALAFTKDVQVAGIADDKRPDINMSAYISSLLSSYNTDVVDADKQIYLGEVPGAYSSSITSAQRCEDRVDKHGNSSWGDVKARLDDLGSGYGGHWRTRYVNGRTYLDFLKNYFQDSVNTQTIALKKNLLDFSNNYEVDNIFTVVIPLGTTESKSTNSKDSSANVTVTTTIEGYNTNLHEKNYIKVSDLVNIFSASELNQGYHSYDDYANAINRYGMIYKTVSFPNADSPALLWEYATDWIKNNYLGVVSDFSIKVIDMHQLGETPTYTDQRSTQKYLVGDRVTVQYPVYDSGEVAQLRTEVMTIKNITYDLFNPENTTLTIGPASDLLDHEYGSKKTKAKKTKAKDDGGGTPTPTGGSGGGGGNANGVHWYIRRVLANVQQGYGAGTLKSSTLYEIEVTVTHTSVVIDGKTIKTYRIATYVGKNDPNDQYNYGVYVSASGVYILNIQTWAVVGWIWKADENGNITIGSSGVVVNLWKQMDKFIEFCRTNKNIKAFESYDVLTIGDTIIDDDPIAGTTITNKKLNLHEEVRRAIVALNNPRYPRDTLYKTYKVASPIVNVGVGFKRIATFKDKDDIDCYILIGKTGIGISRNGTTISTMLFQPDENGLVDIGSNTYDLNKDLADLATIARSDTAHDVNIQTDGHVNFVPESKGTPNILIDPREGQGYFGHNEDGSWWVKLNDEITYTDVHGEAVTAKGFVSAKDFNVSGIPSFKTKLVVVDQLIGARATVGELTTYQLTVATKFTETEQQLQAQGANIAKIDGDITIINGDVSDLDARLINQGLTITRIDSDVTTIGGDLTDAQAEIASNGQSITAINSDIVDITGELNAAKAKIGTLEANKLSTTMLHDEIANIDLVDIKAALVLKDGAYIRFEGSRDKMYWDQFVNIIVDVKDGSYSNNTKTVNFVTLDGTKKPITFSRATSLDGEWSGTTSAAIFTVSATPQGDTYTIGFGNVTADHHLGISTGTPSIYKNSNNEEDPKLLSVPIYLQTLSDSGYTTRYTVTPKISAVLAWSKGEAIGETNGWAAAYGKVSVPPDKTTITATTKMTSKWPDSSQGDQIVKEYELYEINNNTIGLRYDNGTSSNHDYKLVCQKVHNRYTLGWNGGGATAAISSVDVVDSGTVNKTLAFGKKYAITPKYTNAANVATTTNNKYIIAVQEAAVTIGSDNYNADDPSSDVNGLVRAYRDGTQQTTKTICMTKGTWKNGKIAANARLDTNNGNLISRIWIGAPGVTGVKAVKNGNKQIIYGKIGGSNEVQFATIDIPT